MTASASSTSSLEKTKSKLHPYLQKVLNDSVSLGHDLWTQDDKEHACIPHTFRRFSGLETIKNKAASIPLEGSQ
jgi:hypothetical protein